MNWITLKPDQSAEAVSRLDIYQIRLQHATFIFYYDTCSVDLNVDIVDKSFAVSDYIRIDYNLNDATALNVPIYITSDDIGFDYKMLINENGAHYSIIWMEHVQQIAQKALKLKIIYQPMIFIVIHI